MIKSLFSVLSLAGLSFLIYCVLPSVRFRYFAKAPFRTDKGSKRIMLTFDDGPDPRYTGKLLDVLASSGVRATFFLVADKAAENPELVRRILEGGHKIGFHSLAHQDTWRVRPAYQKREFEAGLEILQGLGCKPEYYRAPWGHLNLLSLALARKHHLKIILWTAMAQDWEESSTAERIISRLVGRTKSGGILCLHDSGCGKAAAEGAPGETIEAVAGFIPLMMESGFTFVLPGA